MDEGKCQPPEETAGERDGPPCTSAFFPLFGSPYHFHLTALFHAPSLTFLAPLRQRFHTFWSRLGFGCGFLSVSYCHLLLDSFIRRLFLFPSCQPPSVYLASWTLLLMRLSFGNVSAPSVKTPLRYATGAEFSFLSSASPLILQGCSTLGRKGLHLLEGLLLFFNYFRSFLMRSLLIWHASVEVLIFLLSEFPQLD